MKNLGQVKSNLVFSVILLAAVIFLTGCPKPDISKGPYLQDVTKDGITICWETTEASRGMVNYAASGSIQAASLSVAEDIPRTFHEIRLNNLSTETQYDYQIFNKVKSALFDSWVDIAGPQSTFRTAPNKDTPFRFAVWGDSQDNPDIFGRLTGLMKDYEPDIAIGVGDLVTNGWDLAEWEKKYFTPMMGFNDRIPVFSAIGNHEIESPFFYMYFSQPGNDHWFSFTYGSSIFIVLDTNTWFPGTIQNIWLKNLIGSDEFKNARFKFAFFHHPAYTELWNGYYYDGNPVVRETLTPILEEAGVDVIFNGHTHAYERGRQPLEGEPFTYYVVTGGGGGGLDTQAWKDWPQLEVIESQHHFMIVDVDGDNLNLSAVNVDGDIIDSFSK
jgi:acid phosphatase type 7